MPGCLRSRMRPLLKTFFRLATAVNVLTHAWAASNFNAVDSFSWASNLGWLNWRGDVQNGVEVDQFICAGFLYSANAGWINMGNGAPSNGIAYQNNSASDFGVNVDSAGNLTGFAYGANIGWINFAASGRPQIDLHTGRLTGFVYGANVGWFNLGDVTFAPRVDTLAAGRDSDGDGIPDAWEISHVGNLTSLTATGDFDHDGQSDLEEYLADTDPTDPADNLRIVSFSLTTLTWTTRPTRQYSLQSRSSFDPAAAWVDSGLGVLSATGPNLSTPIPSGFAGTQRYFRVQAVRPLSP